MVGVVDYFESNTVATRGKWKSKNSDGGIKGNVMTPSVKL